MPSHDALLVVGHGMVGHRLVTRLLEAGGLDRWDITVVGEELRPAYDRIALSSLFSGAQPADLSLVEPGLFDRAGLRLICGEPVVAIDPDARTATTSAGHILHWDSLVLATGSVPFVPPLPGREAAGCFVYRTTEDVEAIRAYAASRRVGVVIGGGLLGLEAAGGLRSVGMDTHVVEFAPRLMPVRHAATSTSSWRWRAPLDCTPSSPAGPVRATLSTSGGLFPPGVSVTTAA